MVDLTSEVTQKSKEPKHVPVLGFVLVAVGPLPEAGRPAREGKKLTVFASTGKKNMFGFQQYFLMKVFYFKQVNAIASTIPTKAGHCRSVQGAIASSSHLAHLFLSSSCVSYPFLSSSVW